MKHSRSPRHVRVPLVGRLSMRLLLAVGGVALLIVLLLLTLVPLWKAHREATEAATELQQANAALSAQKMGVARGELVSARGNVDDSQRHINGMAADLWSHMPVVGSAVDDGRHLVSALDQATTVGSIGVSLIDQATSPGSHLVQGTQVNMPEVEQLSAKVDRIGTHLHAAQAELSEVRGDDPVLGSKIDALKQQAQTQLATADSSYRKFKPLLDRLPSVLGAKAPQTYLLTILNPAEQRYSGGATLQMATIHVDDGAITFGPSQTVADLEAAQPFLNWQPVRGNLFHPPGPRRLTAATFSPWWQVSGEELLRGWRAQTGQRCQGLIAVDIQALAELFRISGPMHVAGYGELNADNLVHTLAGDYDSFTDPSQRHRLNNALVPAFREKFFSGGDFIDKGRSLMQDAQARHVAMYFRDLPSQQAFATAGFAGNLSTTRHDYLGVFSQNLNGSKADYWQTRQVSSKVALHADGSAHEKLSVVVANPAPPYLQPTPDPKTGYFTRWLGATVGVFLPPDTRLGSVASDGEPLAHASLEQASRSVRGVLGRPMLHHTWMLGPQQSGKLTATYTVPHAASVDPADGSLTYQVDLDPQDLVQPQSNAVTLTIPTGFRFGTLPAGWSLTNPHTAALSVPQLTVSSSWQVPVLKG